MIIVAQIVIRLIFDVSKRKNFITKPCLHARLSWELSQSQILRMKLGGFSAVTVFTEQGFSWDKFAREDKFVKIEYVTGIKIMIERH